MTTHTEELFETIILHPHDFDGQRRALAFFGAGTHGIFTARRVAKRLKAEGVVAPPKYLGGAQIEIITGPERKNSTQPRLYSENTAAGDTYRWFEDNVANIAFSLGGDPYHCVARSVVFVTENTYASYSCIGTIYEWSYFVGVDRVTTIAAFEMDPENGDWLDWKLITPTVRFPGHKKRLRTVRETLLVESSLKYDVSDQRHLAQFLEKELEVITGRTAA